MGSEDEEGRWDAEGPRHLVTIESGFWMFDTPCTQALWEAVMGENPSRFKGAGSSRGIGELGSVPGILEGTEFTD